MEFNHFRKVLQNNLVDVTVNPTLMLNFTCRIKGIPTIDLTKDEVEVCYPASKGNIANDSEGDIEMPTTALGSLTHYQTIHNEPFQNPAPPTDMQQFSPQSISSMLEWRRPQLTLMYMHLRIRQAMTVMYLMQKKMTSKWSLMK